MPTQKLEWSQIKIIVLKLVERRKLGDDYLNRLKFEIKEIEKQGANGYWATQYNEGIKYQTNKNGLVLPWLLGLTPVDPMLSNHRIIQSTDMPDIDIDCLPDARDKIKAYAAQKYGNGRVCSVGAWTTYKFKSALTDAARGLGIDTAEIGKVAKELPDDVNDLKDDGYAECLKCKKSHNAVQCPECRSSDIDGITIGSLLAEYDALREYNDRHPEVVDAAVRLVGKIKNMGKHAGGIIISSQELMGNVPMALGKASDDSVQWISMWTEGRNTQLSKFGYVKWDILGLKTLQYIHETCKLIEQTRGIKFNILPWKDNNPEANTVGWYTDASGQKQNVPMDDPDVFKMINDLRTETLFQFETDVQRNVLSNGVRDYFDLQAFNAMGHPGPIAFIPEYAERRDDKNKSWRKDEHPDIAAELDETYGIIVYQEQLQKLWQKFAGFTAPEAEAARKAVAKKWVEKLKPIREKWIIGATKTLGAEWAEKMWPRMETFGRYAFNKSHSTAYILVAYWCAWLKTHYAPEWWASVMSSCHSDRIPRYMNVARLEGVKFGTMSVGSLTWDFSVAKSLQITPGLTGIKGIGTKAAKKITVPREYSDIDDFVKAHGKSKSVMEPLIKLGAFKALHKNSKALWMWYMYRYCTDKPSTPIRKEIKWTLMGWTQDEIDAERVRRAADYRSLYPKRAKIPASISKWMPPVVDTRENVMALYPDDFSLKDVLEFEKKYLGYYWHSPMDLYQTKPGATILNVKNSEGKRGEVEGVIEKIIYGKTKNNKKMARIKLSDGLSNCTIVLWADHVDVLASFLVEGMGARFKVLYDESRDSFTLERDSIPIPLDTKAEFI